VSGINVHPGKAKDKLVNAVKVAAAIIERFHKDRMSPETTKAREGYIHPHGISGGVEETVVKILIRDFSERGLVEKEDYIRGVCQAVQPLYPTAKIECTVIKSYRNMKIVLDKYPEVMQKAEQAVAMAGLKPERQIIRGGTDGARLSFMGLPTPNLFTGGNNYHSRYEWVSLQDMQKASEVIVHLMAIWAAG
jgi:tripeptide aminopeptidase